VALAGTLAKQLEEQQNMSGNADATTQDLHRWFFEMYVPNWVAVGTSELDPEVMLSYWDAPVHIAGEGWLLTADAVTHEFHRSQGALADSGYADTSVIDHEITVYNDDGGTVDAILSRRRRDGSEIQRVAGHFEIHRTQDGWRIVAIATAVTTADAVAEVWHRISGRPARGGTASV
jgi:hypothetical protein